MNRKALEQRFLSPSPAPWKTFVMDVHDHGDPLEFLLSAFGDSASHGPASVGETEDRYLYTIDTLRASFVVDSLDGRFWSFHSESPASDANAFLRSVVARRRDVDFVWLPSAHLRGVQRDASPVWIKTEFRGRSLLPLNAVQELSVKVRGREAQALLDVISRNDEFPYAVSVSQLGVDVTDPDLGSVREAIDRLAIFVAQGDSFALHQSIVQGVVKRYKGLVEAAEGVSLGFDAFPHENPGHLDETGGVLTGGPIEFTFSRPLTDLDRFLDGLLSSREPFRLWGIANDVSDDYSDIEAVDLHVGQRIRLEVSKTMIRIHLRRGGCGNTVARLVSNLQHHVDGGLTATDPAIDEHLRSVEPALT